MFHHRGLRRLEPGLTLEDDSSDDDDGLPLHTPILNGGAVSSSAMHLEEFSALNGIGGLKPQQHCTPHSSLAPLLPAAPLPTAGPWSHVQLVSTYPENEAEALPKAAAPDKETEPLPIPTIGLSPWAPSLIPAGDSKFAAAVAAAKAAGANEATATAIAAVAAAAAAAAAALKVAEERRLGHVEERAAARERAAATKAATPKTGADVLTISNRVVITQRGAGAQYGASLLLSPSGSSGGSFDSSGASGVPIRSPVGSGPLPVGPWASPFLSSDAPGARCAPCADEDSDDAQDDAQDDTQYGAGAPYEGSSVSPRPSPSPVASPLPSGMGSTYDAMGHPGGFLLAAARHEAHVASLRVLHSRERRDERRQERLDELLNHLVWNDAGRSVAQPQPVQRHYVESLRTTVAGMSATLLPDADHSIHTQPMQFSNAPNYLIHLPQFNTDDVAPPAPTSTARPADTVFSPSALAQAAHRSSSASAFSFASANTTASAAAINKGTKVKMQKEPESKFKWKPLKIAKTSR